MSEKGSYGSASEQGLNVQQSRKAKSCDAQGQLNINESENRSGTIRYYARTFYTFLKDMSRSPHTFLYSPSQITTPRQLSPVSSLSAAFFPTPITFYPKQHAAFVTSRIAVNFVGFPRLGFSCESQHLSDGVRSPLSNRRRGLCMYSKRSHPGSSDFRLCPKSIYCLIRLKRVSAIAYCSSIRPDKGV